MNSSRYGFFGSVLLELELFVVAPFEVEIASIDVGLNFGVLLEGICGL